MTKYKSDTKGELIPTVIVEFHDLPDLWLTKDQYTAEGGFSGLLKSMSLCIGWVKKVHHLLKNPNTYPVEAWEG